MENRTELLRLQAEFPLKKARKLISGRLSAIWHEAVHVTVHKDIDVTAYYERRELLRQSFIDYVYHTVVQVLKKEPFHTFNSYFHGDVVKTYSSVNLGLAMDHPKGLVVPVLHLAEQLDIGQFAAKRKELIARTKQWKHEPWELDQGTFTISNLGPLGIDGFTPILNPPQVAILGLGRVWMQAFARDWEEAPARKAIIPFSLTIDHRVLDGADAAKFVNAVEKELNLLFQQEEPI
ncbi:2-oxo acid dehydrogenase subunit E2 [Paenibacillus sp. GCM10027626]|uniref:2-oxo acid dehydrogenase subunit E2 n=1 Tax=Paenibacillus sp. GCM10027626 TaxID=3273411 RepID=UPI00363F43B1